MVAVLVIAAGPGVFAQDTPATEDVPAAITSLTWNTFGGSFTVDQIGRSAVDAAGNQVVVGTSSASWGSPVNAFSGSNAVVAKYDANGALVWNTFLGSSNPDVGHDIAVDASGRVYVVGTSQSTWGSPLRSHSGGNDVFVARLASNGALDWVTFLGGSATDRGAAITVSGNDVYVAGVSEGAWGFAIRTYSGGSDVFVARLNNAGAYQWHTFLGGPGNDEAADVLVNSLNEVYVAGASDATWGTPAQTHHGGTDAMVSRLNTGGALVWNTFVGGAGDDRGNALAANGLSGVILGGRSSATWGNTPPNRFNGGTDGMIATVSALGTSPLNTFLGSATQDAVHDVVVDGSGNIYFVGVSDAAWGAPVRAYTGNTDAVVGKLNSSFILQWNSFIGGVSPDTGASVHVLSGNGVALAGESFGSWGTPLQAYSGNRELFAALLPDYGPRVGQTITFTLPAQRTVGDPPLTLNATASSGLPVTYRASGPCTVQGNTVTLTNVSGSCLLVANQEGSLFYAAATDVVRSFFVLKANQTITFAALTDKTFGNAPFAVSATASSGLPVAFSTTTPAQCTVAGSTVTIIGAGTCTIVAAQAGNDGYNAAVDVSRSFNIAKADQTIAFAALADKPFGSSPFAVTPTASSGLAVGVASTTPDICTVSGGTVTVSALGTCTLQATQAGNANYNPAPAVSQSFSVTKADQTITFAALPDKPFGSSPFAVNPTASSGLAVSVSGSTPAVCTVAGATVTVVATGTCTLQATQAGNANYNPAPAVSQSFSVTKADQTITFAALADRSLESAPFAVNPTASSGLAVSVASSTPAVCTVSGMTVTVSAAGTCTIQATQGGNANYNPAPAVSRSFSVLPAGSIPQLKLFVPSLQR